MNDAGVTVQIVHNIRDPHPEGRVFTWLRERWAIASSIAILLVLIVLQAGRVFPEGGDPGHMIGVASGAASAPYPPFVPHALRFLYDGAGGADGSGFFAVRLFGVASMLAMASGMAAVTRRLAGQEHEGAARIAFLLAIASPTSMYQVLWGGTAQFWGLGLGLHGVAHAFGWTQRRMDRILAVFLLAAVAYTHWYSATFVFVAAGVVVARQHRAFTRNVFAESGAWLAVGVALMAPMALFYLRLASDLRVSHGAALLDLSYWPGLWAVVEARSVAVLAGVGVAAVALLVARVQPEGSFGGARAWTWTLAWLLGFIMLLAMTPAQLAGRAYYLLPLLLIPMAAQAFPAARRTRFFVISPDRTVPFRAAPALAVGLALLVAGGVVSYARDRDFFSPMGVDSLEAFRLVRDDAGVHGAAVFSPFANVDGWWMEAVARKHVSTADVARLYSLKTEVSSMDALRRAEWGEFSAAAGSLVVLASPTTMKPAPLTVAARTASGDVVPLLTLEEASSSIVFGERVVPLRAKGDAGPWSVGSTFQASWINRGGTVERTVRPEGSDVVVEYAVPGNTTELHLLVGPGDEGSFTMRGNRLDHSWWPGGSAARHVVRVSPAPLALGVGGADVLVKARNGTATLRLHVDGQAAAAFGPWSSGADLVRSVGANVVYVRDVSLGVRQRFNEDRAFHSLFNESSVAVFKVGEAEPHQVHVPDFRIEAESKGGDA